jgi:hypothetical protein
MAEENDHNEAGISLNSLMKPLLDWEMILILVFRMRGIQRKIQMIGK